MSRVSKPTNKVIVFDPTNGATEAATTDLDEMARRERVKAKEAVEKAETYRLKKESKKSK